MVNGANGADGKTHRVVTPKLIIPDEFVSKNNASDPNYQYRSNEIHTSKYNWITFLPKNLFEQFYRFANLYFLMIQILNWLPGMEVFVREVQLMPLLFVLSVTAIKDLFEDRRRHLSDKRVNNMICRRYDKKTKKFSRTKWKNIEVGDLIHLSCDEVVPADILLLRAQSAGSGEDGVCFVETANLDGENNLKQRYCVPNFAKPNVVLENADFNFVVQCEKPNMKLHKFQGTVIYTVKDKKIPINKENLLLRDCVLKNTSYAEGLVIYAGHETKAMLNNKGPRHKRSRLEKMMNRDIVMCVVMLIIMCVVGFLGRYLWLDQYANLPRPSVPYTSDKNPIESLSFSWPLESFAVFVIIYQMIIPISLYVCIEMVKLGQVYLINRDDDLLDRVNEKRCECRAWNITEDLGQVEYMFCDKTGTLTENLMEFWCCAISGINYGQETKLVSSKEDDMQKYICSTKDLIEKLKIMGKKYSNFSRNDNELELSPEETVIHHFFMVLAICNTANRQYLDQKSDDKATSKINADPDVASRISDLNPKNEKNAKDKNKFAIFQVLRNRKRDDGKIAAKAPTSEIPVFESESPDEVALVTAAYNYGFRMLKRTRENIDVELPGGTVVNFKILSILPFDSDRKRMSVIIKCPFTNQIIMYSKGSDQTMFEKLSQQYVTGKEFELNLTKKHLLNYSNKGLRVLCMGQKVIAPTEYQEWTQAVAKAENAEKRDKYLFRLYNKIENQIDLLGCTAIEDKLQYRVPEVIESVRKAGIMVWVLTGDKMETAISIAKSCSLFDANVNLLKFSADNVKSKKTARQELVEKLEKIRESRPISTLTIEKPEPTSRCLLIFKKIYDFLNRDGRFENKSNEFSEIGKWGLVIDGPSLNYFLHKDNLKFLIELTRYCGSVLCCRVSPSQKSYVVKCVKNKLNVLTVAVGDGANDVSMIQTAHVGIGVFGKEGTQAAMASDFAIPRFYFIERLLLVHGNLNYNRLAMTILYFFYKNTMVVFILFVYQFHSGFSGTSLIDDLFLMLVNIFYTTLPAIVRGILEKDCDEAVFLKFPSLYERGRKSLVYTYRSFWVNTVDSIYQALVIFYFSYFTYSHTGVSNYEFGLIIFILIIVTNLLQIAMETKYWNKYFMESIIISIGWFLTSVLFMDFNYSNSIIFLLGGHYYKLLMHVCQDKNFFAILFLVPVIALMPRFTLRALQHVFNPQFVIPKSKIYEEWTNKNKISASRQGNKNEK